MVSDPLFAPLAIGSMQLAHRLVIPRMTRFDAPDGILADAVTPCYARALIANADWANIVPEPRHDALRAYDPKAAASLEPA
jgi:2,4-dienoyl-CoA reductase-like NADH-dependent reductase (Old Yellow Enzyme family)